MSELQELTDAMVMCRTVGHAWDEWTPKDRPSTRGGWPFTLRCTRCTTERWDVIATRTGELIQRRYLYPDGYRLAQKGTRLAVADLRRELARRHRSAARAA